MAREREKNFVCESAKTTMPSGAFQSRDDTLRLGPLGNEKCFLRVNGCRGFQRSAAQKNFLGCVVVERYCGGGFRREFRLRNMICSSGLNPRRNFGSFNIASWVVGLIWLSIARCRLITWRRSIGIACH
jgi:hypothetical protein